MNSYNYFSIRYFNVEMAMVTLRHQLKINLFMINQLFQENGMRNMTLVKDVQRFNVTLTSSKVDYKHGSFFITMLPLFQRNEFMPPGMTNRINSTAHINECHVPGPCIC